jgi:hypothetical protein
MDAACVRELAGCDVDAADRAVSTLCRAEAEGVVVFTNRPEAVACRANRNSKVRGAAAENVARIRSIQRSIGANLLCIDPSDRSQFDLRNLLRETIAGETPVAPKGWRD